MRNLYALIVSSLLTASHIYEMWSVVTVANFGYMPYVENLCESIRRAGIEWQLTVLCMDAKCVEYCKEHNIPHEACVTSAPSEYQSWASSFQDFNNTVFQKLTCLRQYLQKHPDVTYCVYLDGDIIVFKDFLPYLKDNYSGYDWVFQCDQNGGICSSQDQCPYMCSGFMVMKNNPFVLDILNYSKYAKDITAFSTDQHYLNLAVRQIHKMQIRITTLPKHLFPNGSQLPSLPPAPFILHYNYLIGAEKKKRMIENGHWITEKDTTPSQ